jgi:hypothetical protein
VSPPGAWHTFSYINLSAENLFEWVSWAFEELAHIENVDFIEMHVFTVTTSKCYDLVIVDGCGGVESFSGVVFEELDFRFAPNVVV